ncbi:MAG: alpha/beta fold hydrolase [bacterium]|nr:alpha/beta fold hydrolase [bacterium]
MSVQQQSDVNTPPNASFKNAWWAFNGHVHTVVSSQFLPVANVDCTRIEIPTPDSDFLELDIVEGDSDKPVVAIFHGLEGSSERFYVRNLMDTLYEQGISSIAMNFRGCGRRINDQPRFYHSGETNDYFTLFDWIKEHYPTREHYAVGFSLGGNALIKSLGEADQSHPVKRAVAVSPPYDLKRGSINLQKGFNRVYELRFMRTLKKKLALKREQYPELPNFSGSTLYDFDDQITAPVHGFNNADHYYESCSSKGFLSSVQTPLLLIHSKEDTLTPLAYAPFSVIEENEYIHSIFTENGGHVGFISSPRNWLNQTIVRWLMQD